jgi:hypothetical protein
MGLFSKKETPAKRSADEMAQTNSEQAGPSQGTTNVASPAGPADTGNPASEGTVLDASEEPIKDILLQIPLAELHQVNGNVEKLLEKGSLVAFGVTFPKTGASMMALEMNETRWWLRPDMATLKVGLCTYMLDVTQPGSQEPTFFCITFADDTLPEAVGTFEGLLEEVTQYNESERLLSDPTAASGDMAIAEGLTFTNKAASSLHWASVKVAGGILMGADAVSKRMTDHAAKVQASSEPGAPRPVPGAITASASMTRAGTKVLSKTAGKIVNAVAAVPVYVAEKLAGSGKPGDAAKPQSATKQVVTAGAVSFTMVYEGLEQGAKIVLTGARDSASGIAGHKYGPDAGQVTGDMMASVGHTANAYTSYRNIAVRAIARKTAKTTAKRMLYNYMGKPIQQPGVDPKSQGKLLVQQQAQSMKGGRVQPSGGSQHHVMLESHNSRSSLGARPADAKAPQ